MAKRTLARGGKATCGCTFFHDSGRVNKLCPEAIRLYSQPGIIVQGSPAAVNYSAHLNAGRKSLATAS